MKRLAWVPLLFLLSGCSASKDDAIVSLFEYTFNNSPWPVCVSIFGNDPSEELLARIVEKQPKVVPASTCKAEEIESGGGWSVGDEDHVTMIRITGHRWKGPKKVTFSIVYDSNFWFGSAGHTITVEKLSGYWIPTENSLDWIS